MTKGITFGDKDEALVNEIMAYKKENDIDSFVEAVRRLCKKGLEADNVIKKLS